VCESKLVDAKTHAPITFYELPRISAEEEYSWMCGGCAPCFRASLEYLIKTQNVGLIVTLMIAPLKAGRLINHVPYNHEGTDDETEWTDTDDIVDLLSTVEICHIPVADAGMIVETNKLVDTVKAYHEARPDKKVYFHCWGGKGRTSVALIYYLMTVHSKSYNDACQMIYKCNPRMKLSSVQWNFLQSEPIAESDISMYEPIIKTPPDHKCYRIEETDNLVRSIVSDILTDDRVIKTLPDHKYHQTEEDDEPIRSKVSYIS